MEPLESQRDEALIKSGFSEDLVLDSSSKAINETPTSIGAILGEGDEGEGQKCSKTPNGVETTDSNDDFVLDSSSKALGETPTDIRVILEGDGNEDDGQKGSNKTSNGVETTDANDDFVLDSSLKALGETLTDIWAILEEKGDEGEEKKKCSNKTSNGVETTGSNDDIDLDSSWKALDETPTNIRAILEAILEEGDEGEGEKCSSKTPNGVETTDSSNPRNSDINVDDFVLDSSSKRALGKTPTGIIGMILQEGDEGQGDQKHSEKPEGEEITAEALDENNSAKLKLKLNIDKYNNASFDFPYAIPRNFDGDDDDGRRAFDLNFPAKHPSEEYSLNMDDDDVFGYDDDYYYGGSKLKKHRMEENTIHSNLQEAGFSEEDDNGVDLELRIGLSSARN